MVETQKKNMLEDVVLLRLLLIFFLVWCHAFGPFTGSWELIEEYPKSELYYWLGKSLTFVQIQTLIFISGYLLGHNVNRKPEALNVYNCVVKKIRRLIMPSIIFSILYYVIFFDLSIPWYSIIYKIINGCGHMWFLPMIFWCFVWVYILERLKIKFIYALALAVAASVCSMGELPFRLVSTMHNFVFFYLGYAIKRGYFNKFAECKHLLPIASCVAIYIVGLVVNDNLKANPVAGGGNPFIIKVLYITTVNLLHTLISVCGIMALYWSTHYFIIGKYKLPTWSITLSGYCYGVYICQQFILQWLYYHTSISTHFSWQCLPWIGMVITILCSLLLVHLMLKTRVGRLLIG